eukprot:CAMPEP_0201588346 /NCGR_PEP_ID=MMETSP0190_2-20130828/153978_1 /ASSEMBLY_ACC=CAM_ASM_000263 /TAXON_ID=37353 /ORGANISM="Rosalina sp." /LENGTH=65 /DNA_ID=CAMNT_0048040317 /DNA_START=93 /DNA_END=287 /DNA_ORIENTATION=-
MEEINKSLITITNDDSFDENADITSAPLVQGIRDRAMSCKDHFSQEFIESYQNGEFESREENISA